MFDLELEDGERKKSNMGPDTTVSVPLLQPCEIFNRPHEQRIRLSLNGGFLEDIVTYAYLSNLHPPDLECGGG